jgi:hypothetical protein
VESIRVSVRPCRSERRCPGSEQSRFMGCSERRRAVAVQSERFVAAVAQLVRPRCPEVLNRTQQRERREFASLFPSLPSVDLREFM